MENITCVDCKFVSTQGELFTRRVRQMGDKWNLLTETVCKNKKDCIGRLTCEGGPMARAFLEVMNKENERYG
tara:strand:+ start:1228 stop:1443 length:216 start_codon:yes stop_codon:yes gene_type:complete